MSPGRKWPAVHTGPLMQTPSSSVFQPAPISSQPPQPQIMFSYPLYLLPLYSPISLPRPQNADKLYKGQLSEFTPLASLHAPPRQGGQRQGEAHHRSAANPHRSAPLTKKTMFTRWQRAPDYCTFAPLLRFADGSGRSKQGDAYNGAVPETSV